MGSRRFYYPIAKAKNGKIPAVKKTYDGERKVFEHIATARLPHFSMIRK